MPCPCKRKESFALESDYVYGYTDPYYNSYYKQSVSNQEGQPIHFKAQNEVHNEVHNEMHNEMHNENQLPKFQFISTNINFMCYCCCLLMLILIFGYMMFIKK